MPIISIQTLFLQYSALSLFSALIFALYFWGKKDISARYWIASGILTAVASTVTVFRGQAPLMISYSLMVSIEIVSLLMIREALVRLNPGLQKKRFSAAIWLFPVFYFLLMEVMRHLSGGKLTTSMTGLTAFVYGMLHIASAYAAFSAGKQYQNRLFFNFLALNGLIIGTLHMFRTLSVVTEHSGFAFDSATYNMLTWFSITLFCTLRYLTYIVLRLQISWSEHSRLNDINQRISTVLDERNQLILTLEKLNKSASVNALASTIAHEINQPLGASRLNAEFIMHQLNKKPEEVALLKEVTQAILDDIDRASRIIESLSKLTRGIGAESAQIDIGNAIREVVEISKIKLRKANIQLEYICELPCEARINQGEFQQVLINILNNAIEAIEAADNEHKIIKINLSRMDGKLCLTIQDNGVGIPKGREQAIFNLMVTSKTTGTGIGLWLSKDIIQRYDGKIEATHVQDGGACFMISLPLSINELALKNT